MKKAVYMALGVLLCLFWLTACGKSGAAETSGTIEARPGGCYLMTEETPDASGDPFDCYHFSVLHDGVFWGILSVYEAYGETTFQFSPAQGGAGIRAASRSVVAGASHPLCVGRGRPVCRRRGYRGDPHA